MVKQERESYYRLGSSVWLLYICEYLGVTPKEFFDEEINEPQLVQKLYELTRNMSEADLNVLITTAERLNDK